MTARAAQGGADRVAALDGVRGIAILLVMIFHMTVMKPQTSIDRLWANAAGYGNSGVDVFFTLSGYLITGILLATKGEGRYFSNFYIRRLLRIFPLYYLIVVISFLVIPHFHHPKLAKFATIDEDAIFYWLHMSNFAIARRGVFIHGILDISWSLAIEEQFYLLWPAVVFFTSRRGLLAACGLLVVVAVVSRALILHLHFNTLALYTLTPCRLDGLAIGAALALYARGPVSPRIGLWARRVAIGTGIFLLAVAIPMGHPTAVLIRNLLWNTAVSVETAAWLVLVAVVPATSMVSFFSSPILRWLGRYSYALYLFHYPVNGLIRDVVFPPARFPLILGSPLLPQLFFYGFAMAVSCIFAYASWELYEKHFLKLKDRFAARPAPDPIAPPPVADLKEAARQ